MIWAIVVLKQCVNGGLSSWHTDRRVLFVSFLVDCFLLPECRGMKLLLAHLSNKCTVPLLLNPLFSRVSATRSWEYLQGSVREVHNLDSHTLYWQRAYTKTYHYPDRGIHVILRRKTFLHNEHESGDWSLSETMGFLVQFSYKFTISTWRVLGILSIS
jgi:hypothetical protein